MKMTLWYSQKSVNSGIKPIMVKINGKPINFCLQGREGIDYKWKDKIKVGEYDDEVDTFELVRQPNDPFSFFDHGRVEIKKNWHDKIFLNK